MSGICGFCNFKADYVRQKDGHEYLLERMKGALAHRGGGRNVIRCFLGLSGGFARDGYVILCDADIFNTEELRHLLEAKGFVCQTSDEAEVILGCYLHYGNDCANMLNGAFAFVIWNEAQESGPLFLCRDRLGVKPLFYTCVRDTIVFASEMKALFEFPGVKAVLDNEGLREIFGLFPSRTAGNAVLKNIYEIKPGHNAVYKDNRLAEQKYWDVVSQPNDFTRAEAVAHVRYLVEDAVKRQMRADVPLCTFLSGGLDSSIITAIAAREYAKEGRTLDTFSFDYAENETHFTANSYQSDTDRKWAEQVAALTKTNHTHIVCGVKDLASCLYPAVTARDLPGMADIDASLLYFCREVGQTHRIALTGEGADELFGGYPWFHDEAALTGAAFPWIRQLDFRKSLLSPVLAQELDLEAYAAQAYQNSVAAMPLPENDENAQEHHLRIMTYLNMKWVMANLIERTERMGAHVSFLGRMPYADYRLVEFLWNMPWQFKCVGAPKNLLRDAFADLLPDALINRRKNPFPKIYHPLYARLLNAKMTQILNDPSSPLLPLINIQAFEDFLTLPPNTAKPWYGQLMAGPQLIAFYIQIDYWLRQYNVTVS